MSAETIGIIAGIVSIILAIVAIWQAMYFYTKSKDTESSVTSSLVGIKAQVDTLQSVNSKITDRLTKYVTSPKTDTAQATEITAALRNISDIALKFVPPTQDTNIVTLRTEVLLAYIAIWHSKAETNIWAAISLPRPESFDPQIDWHILCKNIVDRSAADFKYMSDILSKIPVADIQASAYAHLYQEVVGTLGPRVGDTSEHFVRMSQA